ncbi:alpha/beta fold hydrolase [Peribacillus sp. SCS-155]|uniref:alpha/beta fold hydrolase n=1 Tax=Peribacillus sedimenti TaxID=3115297 RepID=UPI003906A8DA
MTEETKLAYIDQGNGETLVLVHGFCGSSGYWEKVIPELTDNFRIIAIDIQGHGKSPIMSETFQIEDLADDICSLLDRLSVGKVFMFGHSLGGYITLAFAEKYQNMLKGAGLVHSTANPDSEEAKTGRTNSIAAIREKGIQRFVDTLIPKLFANADDPETAYKVAKAKEIGYGTNADAAIAALEAMKNRKDRNEILRNSAVPFLLIAGAEDKVVSPDKTFSAKADHIQEVLVEDCGHIGMLEQPQIIAETLKQFVLSTLESTMFQE